MNIFPSPELKANPTIVVLNALSSKGKSILMPLKTQTEHNNFTCSSNSDKIFTLVVL
jgi:hypothetical protein